jgi:phenylacetate-CoA ligase
MVNFVRLMYYLSSAMRRLYWDRDKLRRYQEKRLRAVVKYAYDNVQFYNEKFKKAGIKPDDIKSLQDLSKIPITSKSELRRVRPQRLVSSEFELGKLKVVRTSGSTGEPFQIYICGAEDDWRKAIYMRANISCGQRPRDRWVVITGPHHFHDTTNIQRRLGIFAQRCVSVFADVDQQVSFVMQQNPDILDGYSGSLFLLAQEFKKRGLKVNPRIIFGTAELIDDWARRFIEDVFDAPYYDQFGCAEVDRSAWECPEKVGYHMDVDSVITQFVDADGEEVSAGEKGEVVYTSLFNYAMPLIRYAVGDVGQPSDEVCPCGRVLPLMKVVEGKKDSFIFLSGRRIISPRAFVIAMRMFKWYSYVEQFRIIQKSLNQFVFLIKAKGAVDESIMAEDLARHFRITFNMDDDVSFDVRFVDEMPLGKSGKLSSVISEVKL